MTDHRSQCLGCFLGKNIGGTLGMPYEGRQQFLDLTFYRPVPSSPSPNDDLDLQLVWLQHLKESGLAVDSQILGQAWLDHIDAHPDEYGVALWNLRRGLRPPLTGLHNNAFTCGMGAAIRSEVWASVFAGQPAAAAWYACQDAQVDHAGDGILAEVFLAAMQADLYTSRDLTHAIDTGLGFLPRASELRRALDGVISAHAGGLDYEAARNAVMHDWGSPNFTYCVMNLCFIIIGLLYGEGDFERSVLYAVNCGQDTDCTGATVGATLGILLGEDGIPGRWREPVGIELAVGAYILDLPVPATVRELVDDIAALRCTLDIGDAPEMPRPATLPAADDFSDELPWSVNDQPVTVDGIHIPLERYASAAEGSVWLEANVVSPVSRPAQLMIASPGMFRCYFDGAHLGVWGAQMPVVPSCHRVCGGRVYNVRLDAGQAHHLRLEVLPTWPTPPVTVALTDSDNRYLHDLSWLPPQAEPQSVLAVTAE